MTFRLKKSVYYKRLNTKGIAVKRCCCSETGSDTLDNFFGNANGQGFQQQATKSVTLLLFSLKRKITRYFSYFLIVWEFASRTR